MGFCRCRVFNLATCSSFKRTNNHSSKAKERTEENFQYLAIKFGRYRSFSRKFVCTVIRCGWTVSFLSSTDRLLHLRAGLCCAIVHGHSHDLFDFPSDNDGMGKVYVAIRKWIDYKVMVTQSLMKKLAIIAWVLAIVTVSPPHFIPGTSLRHSQE